MLLTVQTNNASPTTIVNLHFVVMEKLPSHKVWIKIGLNYRTWSKFSQASKRSSQPSVNLKLPTYAFYTIKQSWLIVSPVILNSVKCEMCKVCSTFRTKQNFSSQKELNNFPKIYLSNLEKFQKENIASLWKGSF